MRLFVYDMLVNVNVIYYVHVCEQARWACSAGSSAIENLCIIIFIITILPFHQPTHHPAIPPANTLSCHSTSWHHPAIPPAILPFHQPAPHPAIPPANTSPCHSTSWHTPQSPHHPAILSADTPPSHHTTQPFYQLTHHPATTPFHQLTHDPAIPSATKPSAIPATDTSEVKKHCCSPCGLRCFVGWAGPRLGVWLRLGRGLHSGAGGGGTGRPWGVVGRPSGATSGTGWTRLIGWWQTWTWEVKLGCCVQCLLPLSLLSPGHSFFSLCSLVCISG